MTGGSLVCRNCATSHPISERFCPTCGMPLVYSPGYGSGGGPITEQHERARKVSPQYGEGSLTKVAWAPNQAEAEMIVGLLLDSGIPSVVRRSGGFDVPDFLAAGPRDILVAESGLDVAREILAEQRTPEQAAAQASTQNAPSWVRALAYLMIGVMSAVGVVFLIAAVVRSLG